MATKSNRSAGSQSTPRGPVQGTALVDPSTGNPVATANGGISVTPVSQFITVPFDTIIKNNASPTQEVFTYKTGGLSGTTVATLTVNYTDSTKSDILNVVRT